MASYSISLKNELVFNESSDKKSLLKGMLQINASINLQSSGLYLEFKTKNKNIADLLISLIKELYGFTPTVNEEREKKLNKELVYVVLINQNATFILRDLSIMQSKEDSQYSLKRDIVDEQSRVEYLKGAFLSTGSINDPASNIYHLEIQTFNTIVATNLRDLMNTFNLRAKISQNRRGFIVYLKSSERISDFVRLVGASESFLYFENIRIEKDLSNSINRVVNCEIANQKRTEASSKKQLEEIEAVLSHYSSQELSNKNLDIIKLRKENPDDSLQELSDKSENSLGYFMSRSTINHRLKAIHELYTKITK